MANPTATTGAGFRLLIDAGNSRIKWALIRDDGAREALGAFAHLGLADDALARALPAPQEPQWDALPAPSGVWISNVAGAQVAARLDTLIDARWPSVARTTIVSRRTQCGVTNAYREPTQLGTDRWAGMIGAHAAYPGEHLLIVTLGTATTLEALRADGTFIGGLIAPGWSLMMHSLGQHTAQLPTLTPASARSVLVDGPGPGAAHAGAGALHIGFGTDTPAALSAGCVLAQTGLIEHAYRAWRDELDGAPVRLLLGGGAADEVGAALTVPHTRHDHLVLSGLAIIAQAASRDT
jgi:type III pantothenate kinase